MGKITSIVYSPEDAPARPADHYTRLPLQKANLLADYGIEGDRKGGHPRRHLNVMCRETLNALAAEGFTVQPGAMGEQIIIEQMSEDLNRLPEGTRLRLGPQAIIEVTLPRTGCDRFEAIQGLHPSLAAGRLGVMARVVQSGVIQIGDAVEIVAHV
jgi:TatD DNase family protein